MTLRIIAGKYKGRLLKTPKGSSTRPTQGMLREAIFNICQNEIQGSYFLDLFAGSGAIGFEALSRGASKVIFAESHRMAISCIKENISLLKAEDQTQLIPAKAERALILLAKQATRFNLVYIDPPYGTPISPYLDALQPLLMADALIFVEERHPPQKTQPPAFLIHLDTRRFGIAVLHQYQLKREL